MIRAVYKYKLIAKLVVEIKHAINVDCETLLHTIAIAPTITLPWMIATIPVYHSLR